jgi:hypothetical protein
MNSRGADGKAIYIVPYLTSPCNRFNKVTRQSDMVQVLDFCLGREITRLTPYIGLDLPGISTGGTYTENEYARDPSRSR